MKAGELKRKTPLRSTKPMQRARSTKVPAARKPMKSKGPRMTPIRRSARDEECTIILPGVCNRRTDTTVLCHDNRLKSGKGMGLKAPDTEAAYGCSCCHDVLDGRRPRPEWLTADMVLALFDLGVERTHQRLKEKGIKL